MTSDLQISPATRGDLVEFYGAVPEDIVEALVGKVDGRVIAVSGVYQHGPAQVAFADFKPEMFSRKKDVVKGCRIVFDYLWERGLRKVYAIADTQIAGSQRFLDWLGFKPTGQMTEIGEYLVKEM